MVGGAALLAGEALAARVREYAKPNLRFAVRDIVGRGGRPTVRLVLLGDATALGVGVERVSETVGGQLAHLLAEGQTSRRVELWSVAVARSRSCDLTTQVARALLGHRPDVAVILIGTSDLAHLSRPRVAATQLGAAVRKLRAAGVATVVGTCPDLGASRALAVPLRQLLTRYGRGLARHQAREVRAAGGVAVDLGAKTGAVFRADPGTLCSDGLHPSADGYRVWAHALLPAVEDATRDSLNQ
jgi:lysophospholipase L1-like esterase